MKKQIFALIDCDSFYASCEKVFRPDIEHAPVIVLSNNDGCVIARSKEAKALDIKMTGVYFKLKDDIKKHGVKVFSSNYTLYGDLSDRMMTIFRALGLRVEEYSIDEAFVDLSHIAPEELEDYAKHLKETIYKWIGLPVKVGIGETKTLAKIAAWYAKRHGGIFSLAYRHDVDKLLEQTPVNEVWGIGWRNVPKLAKVGITNAFQFANMSDDWLRRYYTVVGLRTARELRGEPCIELDTEAVRGSADKKQNIMFSRSFGECVISDKEKMKEAISHYSNKATKKIRAQNSLATAVSVFVCTNRFKDVPQYKKSIEVKFDEPTDSPASIIKYALIGLEHIYRDGYLFKKAGVYLTGLVPKSSWQANLFETNTNRTKWQNISNAVEKINTKTDCETVTYAGEGINNRRTWSLRMELLSPLYTTSFNEMLQINMDGNKS